MSAVSNEQQNAQRNDEARARIMARLRGGGSHRSSTVAAKAKYSPVLPSFAGEERDLVARFVERAKALSCEFLHDGKCAEARSLGKILKSFLTRRESRQSKKTPSSILLFDPADKRVESLDIAQSVRGCCALTELRAGTKGGDFLAAPFPAYALQHATSAIAETGTLVFANETRAQAALTFLPTTHIVLLREQDLVGALAQAFARLSSAVWACHCVSGPSRTADIEQTLHMGAHGPKELCILLYR